jgi:flavin reductase (DIM6/NTAB) family NADH-FMN oxidoreductase RutF
MSLTTIPIERLLNRPYDFWENQWVLLTSGDFSSGDFNAMTVAWGSLGCMWSRPFAQVVVRPTRHTFQFMERYPTFTLCAFDSQHRSALKLLGTRSGRDGNKIAASGLTPIAASQIAAPAFAEATLILECRKLYWHDFEPGHFLDPQLEKNYPQKDYHRVYYGEITAVQAIEAFTATS